ncbi:hypothetical protein [Saccharibacillus alkalitolerans]|uniref:Knr4/Smi1-like domain-containing protein n=1 Tax=Saccharibacillus alkalitolerans TaxID=2705290 RepID=A0ABX0FAF8_9BACL|nr:hypothetical protein [Saccharibacillus alkalitolerans]NGZ77917.1 hypothetical protein [Saccharibacillus alkalitolerans]
MHENLNQIIDQVRTELLKSPEHIVIGKIKDAAELDESAKIIASDYRKVLNLFDGARCGAIDLWSYADLRQYQFRVSDVEGGPNAWIEIGQVLYEPLLLDRAKGSVYLLNTDREQLRLLADNLQSFLKNDVFGPGYAKLFPDCEHDDWYLFLRKMGLVYLEG